MTQLYDYDTHELARLCALGYCDILDTAPEPLFDNLIAQVSQDLQAPIGAINFIDFDRQWFKAAIGVDIKETSRALAFCTQTIKSDAPFYVHDTTKDAQFQNHPWVQSEHHFRTYLGAPIILEPGIRLGTVCVFFKEPTFISAAEREIVVNAAKTVSVLLRKRYQRSLSSTQNIRPSAHF